MRAFVLICVFAIASAKYDYTPGTSSHINTAGSLLSRGEAQLSEPIANEFHKEFYSYSAPEQEFEDAHASEHIANNLKRNLRVLFIKGPEQSGLEQAALQLVNTVSDDRTAIYVLNKQVDIGGLSTRLNLVKTNNHKPEVHFVKYRTQADAENAQRTIQSQYDSLPGPSSSHNAGTSQVLDFASKPANVGALLPPPANDIVAPLTSNEYLPPHNRF